MLKKGGGVCSYFFENGVMIKNLLQTHRHTKTRMNQVLQNIDCTCLNRQSETCGGAVQACTTLHRKLRPCCALQSEQRFRQTESEHSHLASSNIPVTAKLTTQLFWPETLKPYMLLHSSSVIWYFTFSFASPKSLYSLTACLKAWWRSGVWCSSFKASASF